MSGTVGIKPQLFWFSFTYVDIFLYMVRGQVCMCIKPALEMPLYYVFTISTFLV